MNKTIIITCSILLVGLIVMIFIGGSNTNVNSNSTPGQNVEVKNDIQYITIKAGGGYSPKVSTAKAGIPTKLVMETNGIFDCSASLAIHSLNYQKILPQTGETEIDIGTPKAGQPLRGVCGMGMYSFVINFN